MKKPALPPVPKTGEDRTRFDSAVKENLNVLTGRIGTPIALLNRDTATLDDVAAKINELLERLQ